MFQRLAPGGPPPWYGPLPWRRRPADPPPMVWSPPLPPWGQPGWEPPHRGDVTPVTFFITETLQTLLL